MASALSAAGLRELVGHEGVVLSRYKDSVGVWTIGIGHTAKAGPPDPEKVKGKLTLQEVVDLFRVDVQRYADDVDAAVKVAVSQSEFDALVSFHFNTGAISTATLVKSLNAEDRKKAAKEFMNWKKPPEIIPRRKKEQALFAKGIYSNDGTALEVPADTAGKLNWGKAKSIDLSKIKF